MDLDKKDIFDSLDQHHVADSIDTLANQIKQVLKERDSIKSDEDYSQIQNVVLAGMGGSNLGIRILRHAFADQINVPINIVAGYGVPKYVDENTLYILSSYSGTTEEPLSTIKEARDRGAKLMIISQDTDKSILKHIAEEHNIPSYLFNPDANPSGQPRLGLGYSVFGIALLLEVAGIIKVDTAEIEGIADDLLAFSQKLNIESKTDDNMAKGLASSLLDKMPILVGAEFLSGNLHVLRNQLNENAKTFSSYLIIPDANHHAMEGLVNPSLNKEALTFVFFDSELYSDRVKKRMELTKEVVEKNGVEVLSIKMNMKTKQAQCFEALQFGAWASYYLGILYAVDPVAIPWVDWFKKELE